RRPLWRRGRRGSEMVELRPAYGLPSLFPPSASITGKTDARTTRRERRTRAPSRATFRCRERWERNGRRIATSTTDDAPATHTRVWLAAVLLKVNLGARPPGKTRTPPRCGP